MNNSEILEAALNKAFGEDAIVTPLSAIGATLSAKHITDLQNFAKAFWGEEKTKVYDECYISGYHEVEDWKIRLQQMVIKEDPIQYLAQFLDEN